MISPWLQFERTSYPTLSNNAETDVAIVGAGISGVTTLYSLLTTTNKRVVLLERDQVASGATGTNAGLAVAFIEKPFSELVAMLGQEKALNVFTELDTGWDILHAIHKEIGLEENLVPLPDLTNGFTSLDDLCNFIRQLDLRDDAKDTKFWVEEGLRKDFPEDLARFVNFVPQSELLQIIQSIDKSFIAACRRPHDFKVKRTNSALFCYRVLDYLQGKYPNRFEVYEHSDVRMIRLYKDHVVLEAAGGKVKAHDVVLCTNAFTNFSIYNEERQEPHTYLQKAITPRIGYLAAYPSHSARSFCQAFLTDEAQYPNVPIWYMSTANKFSVIGGPEYENCKETDHEKQATDEILRFLKSTFKDAPTSFSHFWHGWMGYTADGMRLVGPDRDHPHLYYNLACNGIGIVPACFSAFQVAKRI
jgi:glycine/D-amino acid oxidase-like deaminating enzyme